MAKLLGMIQTVAQQKAGGQSKLNATLESIGEKLNSLNEILLTGEPSLDGDFSHSVDELVIKRPHNEGHIQAFYRYSHVLMESIRTKTTWSLHRTMVGPSSERNRDHSSPTLGTVIDILTSLFTKSLGYSCINTARSALSCIMYTDSTFCNCSIHQDVFGNRPALPRNKIVWDIVTRGSIALKKLSLKTVTLVALINAQRLQTIHMLSLNTPNQKDIKQHWSLLLTQRTLILALFPLLLLILRGLRGTQAKSNCPVYSLY